jgi:methyltransferase (TIGR00027 family)
MRIPLVPAALHQSDRPSSTAQWTTLGRALELHHPDPILVDRYAPAFLSRSTRGVYRTLLRSGDAWRRAERWDIAGLAASNLCRHRFVDDHLLNSLPSVEQVVILGAGYDARAYRFAEEIGERPVFEVDLPPISRHKAGVVARNHALFGDTRVRRVEIDFRTQSLAERLDDSGFDTGARTFVAWEGVSMYLSREAVDETLDALASLVGPGSTLAMDFWQEVRGAGGPLRTVAQRAMRLIGEPITFPSPAADVTRVLAPSGFVPIDLAEADVLTARYATGDRCCDPGMYVVAARQG